MPKGPNGVKRPADINQLAKMIADLATGDSDEQETSLIRAESGKKGGAARAAALTKEQRADIARKAAAARWKR